MAGMKDTEIGELYTLDETIAKDIFDGARYPWEVLPKIGGFIVALGGTLPEERYEKRGDDVWIAKSAHVYPSACICGPAIIDEEAEGYFSGQTDLDRTAEKIQNRVQLYLDEQIG